MNRYNGFKEKKMFYDFCGKKLPDDSLFCPFCGAKLAGLPPQPDDERDSGIPAFPEISDSVTEKGIDHIHLPGGYTRLNTMKEAAALAISRNSEELWSDSISPRSFHTGVKSLRRECAEWDKDAEEKGSILFYVVSPDGVIAQLYVDDNDEYRLLDWGYFTRHRPRKEMPETIDELFD